VVSQKSELNESVMDGNLCFYFFIIAVIEAIFCEVHYFCFYLKFSLFFVLYFSYIFLYKIITL